MFIINKQSFDETRLLGSDHEKKDVVIPAMYEGKPVSKIGDHAFNSNSRMKSVVIPEGVKAIGESAFADCNGQT